jgi:ERCC4-type nuclease
MVHALRSAHPELAMPVKAPSLILVDSREQMPLEFGPKIPIEIRALAAGDYSTPKLEGRAAVERKAPADLVSTFFSDPERRERQLARLESLSRKVIVVEGSLTDVFDARGGVHMHAIVGTIASLTARYKCPVLFLDNRTLAARFVLGVLGRWEEIAK